MSDIRIMEMWQSQVDYNGLENRQACKSVSEVRILSSPQDAKEDYL